MEAAEARRAVAAAMATASELDLAVDDAIVLSDSNRLCHPPDAMRHRRPSHAHDAFRKRRARS